MLEEAGELPLLQELPSIVLRGKCIHPNIASPYIYHSTKNGDLDPYLGTNQVLNITGFHVRRSPKIWKQDINFNALDETLFLHKWEDDPILMSLESSSSNLILHKYCKAFQTFHGNANNISLDCSSSALASESIRRGQMKEKKKKKKRLLDLGTRQSVGRHHEEGLCSSNSISQISAFLHANDNDLPSKNPHHHRLVLNDELDVCELPKDNVLTQFGNILPNCYWLKINQRRRRRRRRRSNLHKSIPTNATSPLMDMPSLVYTKSPTGTYMRYSNPLHLKSNGSTPCEVLRRSKADSLIESLPLLSDSSVVVAIGDVDALYNSSRDEIHSSDRFSCEITQYDGSIFSQDVGYGDIRLMDKFVNQGDHNSHHHAELIGIASERSRSLSQKYRPNVLKDLVGQKNVFRTLSNAVQFKKDVDAVYLFHGPGGTGKTSAARIFASALNCIGQEEKGKGKQESEHEQEQEQEHEQEQEQEQANRPCGVCKQCKFSDESSDVILEIDAASHNGIENVKALLQSLLPSSSSSSSSPPSSSTTWFKTFIIEECHVLTNDIWDTLLKILENPPRNVVFILITSASIEKIPSGLLSVCRNLAFPKIEESDITVRLRDLAHSENLDAEPGALELIASRVDGSLREAEMILDQLSLLGPKIRVLTVHELFGSVSEEKLMELLDLALSSDTVNTVQKARELIDSGVEPLDLMGQLMSLMTHILEGSGTLKQQAMVAKTQHAGHFFCPNTTLKEEQLDRLQVALKIMLDAEKQLRSTCNDRMTWLTAALLQLGIPRPSITSSSGISENLGNYAHLDRRSVISRKEAVEKKYKPVQTSAKMRNNTNPDKPNFELRYWLAQGEESAEFIHVKESVLSTSDALKVVSSHHFSSSSSILRCQQERRFIEVGSLHYWRSGRSERTEYSSRTRREHDAYSAYQSYIGMPSTPESRNLDSLEIISDSSHQFCSDDFPGSDVSSHCLSYDTEEESLRFESRTSKCGGLLCWMDPKVKRR